MLVFGWKAASWADEVGRHLDRLDDGRRRWLVGQLGARWALGFFGDDGPRLRAGSALVSVSTIGHQLADQRDRSSSNRCCLAMVTGTLARIGSEVMELQRSELGELRRSARCGRGPHHAPQAAILRSNAGHAGPPHPGPASCSRRWFSSTSATAGWKAEWPTFPELCLLSSTALELAVDLVRTLEVDADRMRTNVVDNDLLLSEQVLGAYAARVGKHQAQAELQSLLAGARVGGRSLADAVVTAGVVAASDLATLARPPRSRPAEHAVDVVTARVTRQLDAAAETWP